MLSLALGLVASGVTAAAAADQGTFRDQLCPDATGPGQKLNALNTQASPSGADLTLANQNLLAAYKSCADDFDRQSHERSQGSAYDGADSIIVGRTYARVQEARSLKRSGDLFAQLHDVASAKAAYDRGLSILDELGGIASGASGPQNGGTEPRLLGEARTLRGDIQTAQTGLTAASPAPTVTGSP